MGICTKIKSYLHLQKNIVESLRIITESKITYSFNDLRYRQKYEELTERSLRDKCLGVTNKIYGNNMVIVSLTTHGKRINDVHIAIESIMQGSLKPNKIVLWISEEFKGTPLPITLQKQVERGLEIEYCRDIRSYTKLIYALKKYPAAAIVTIDDDIIYPYDTVENLIQAYLEAPDCICANWIHQIPQHLGNNYISLLQWPTLQDVDKVSGRYFYEGFGGVLYPPYSLDAEVFNENVFLDICKYADDVWFNAMSIKAGTKVKYAWKHYGLIPLIGNKDVQVVALKNVNSNGEVLNDIQIKSVFSKYGLYDKIEKQD